jgi:hypothetical protein
MKLILDTLERARLAASPAEALDVADALTDLEALADALARNGWTLSDAACALDDLKALRDHVAALPFETTDMDDGTTVIDDLTPGAFADWLATLESLAQ